MSEPGKMEEGRDYDVNLYPMSCKAGTGLDSDRLPQELRECTLAEIKSSVVEARSHEALAGGSSPRSTTAKPAFNADATAFYKNQVVFTCWT